MSKHKPPPVLRVNLWIVESLREHGRWQVERACWTRRDARKQRCHYANEQTPRVRVVEFRRALKQAAKQVEEP